MTEATERFAPAPEFRGVPDRPLLRNPTLWVACGAIATWVVGWIGYLALHLPWWVAVLSNVVGDYLGFTVLHESVHRVTLRNRRWNDAVGWLPALLLAFTYPVFRVAHINHHAHTNDPARDPDHWVSHRPRVLLPFWLVSTAVNYRVLFYRNGWGTRAQRAGQQLLDVVLVGGTALAVWRGVGVQVLVVFWLPWLLSGLVLLYAFDYLPHYPFDSTERFRDTRIQPGRLRHALLLGQNYHLIHHLWVSVPWFSYRHVFTALEPQLRAKGARID